MKRIAAVLLMLSGGAAYGQAPVQPQPAAKPGPPDALLNALKAAPSEEAAALLEAQLHAAWINAASPAIRLLMARGQRELSEGAAGDAQQSYDAALELGPDLLEAWRGRATARLHTGDATGAIRDLQEVIRREPRDFEAWRDLSRIAESRGEWRGAYAAWQKLLEVDPKTPGGLDKLKDLRRRAIGEDA